MGLRLKGILVTNVTDFNFCPSLIVQTSCLIFDTDGKYRRQYTSTFIGGSRGGRAPGPDSFVSTYKIFERPRESRPPYEIDLVYDLNLRDAKPS